MSLMAITPHIEDLDNFLSHCHRKRYPNRSTIIYEGDECDTLYYIIKGSVSVILEDDDGKRMKHPVFLFEKERLLDVGEYIGSSLCERLALRILAMTVQTWHVHLLVGATKHDIAKIAKCAKDAVRWGLRSGRPIWSDGYDKRYCFDERSVWNRMRYIERHNLKQDWPVKPWSFIETPAFSPR